DDLRPATADDGAACRAAGFDKGAAAVDRHSTGDAAGANVEQAAAQYRAAAGAAARADGLRSAADRRTDFLAQHRFRADDNDRAAGGAAACDSFGAAADNSTRRSCARDDVERP